MKKRLPVGCLIVPGEVLRFSPHLVLHRFRICVWDGGREPGTYPPGGYATSDLFVLCGHIAPPQWRPRLQNAEPWNSEQSVLQTSPSAAKNAHSQHAHPTPP